MTPATDPHPEIARLSLLDLVCRAADDRERPLDFAFVCHLPQGLAIEGLRAGAESAMKQFPVSGSVLRGNRWRWAAASGQQVVAAASGPEPDLDAWLDAPLDLDRMPPIAQLVIAERPGAGQKLVTRFHHAACDGVGAQLWLAHQLMVATGRQDPVLALQPVLPPRLRRHPAPRRRNRLSPPGPSRSLWTRAGQPGRRRRWLTMSAPSWPGPQGEISETEALAASFLGALTAWDEEQRGPAVGESPLGLWMPVNIRREATRGFGNGTSRVRLHARFDASTPLPETCAILRRELAAALREGEWSPPDLSLLTHMPGLARPLVRWHLRRPGLDMGSAVFTHLTTTPVEGTPALVDRIEGVQMLDRRHPLGLSCVSCGGTTFCTFTYDPALLSREEVVRIGALTCDRLDQLRREAHRRAA